MDRIDKNIVLGVTGGVAAYKSADLCRRLLERGARVRVVMSQGAQAFITPLTFQALSGNPVHTELLDESAEAGMGHIELARWADLILIAPASANTLARLAAGMADDLLSTVCLASDAALMLAPAMNQQMWAAAATTENVARLRARGVLFAGPGFGDQACGDVGAGRLLEPLDIVAAVVHADVPGELADVSVLITAGPTREAIDPVRFISNHSSGKMGYAVACAAQGMGANVTLVSGPSALPVPSGVQRVMVQSAQEMHDVVMQHARQQQIFIAAAAVADYRPVAVAERKIKKSSATENLQLERTADILADVAALDEAPFTVGFAAETDNLHNYAKNKLTAKKINMIAANQVGIDGRGFDADTNAMTVFWPGGAQEFALQNKRELATGLMKLIVERYRASSTA